MAIREMILERIPAQDEVLTISRSGIGFSAKFIKAKALQDKEGVSFLWNDEDSYWFGFRFHDNTNRPNTLKLLAQSRDAVSNGRQVKASEVIASHKILGKIQSLPQKADRTFFIHEDKKNNCFFVTFKPCFEHGVTFAHRGSIPDELGIYRYYDNMGRLLYIGQGLVKSRLESAERREWGIHKIEYSLLRSKEDCEQWEAFYIKQCKDSSGSLPPFNVIAGKSSVGTAEI